MRVAPEHEHPQGGGLDTDAVTFSFADPAAQLYGLARLGLSGEGARRRGSALALLFSGRTPASAIAEGDIPVDAGAGWESLELSGLAASVDAPLERWSLRMTGERHGYALSFEAVTPPAGHGVLAGMAGYEQGCRVRGEAVLDGSVQPVSGRGQRGHSWGSPDWTRLGSVHTVCAWMDRDRSMTVTAAREQGAAGHAGDARWGALLEPSSATPIADPRLSTTYDGEGRQRRAGLELWLGEEDDAPRRAAGSLVCGSSLDLGQLRLECAFMRWTMDGAEGYGRYDVLRRA